MLALREGATLLAVGLILSISPGVLFADETETKCSILDGDTAEICSFSQWNNTGINVVRGMTYSIRSSGNWIDKEEKYSADARGFESPNWIFWISEWLRRRSDSHWLALICGIGRNEDTLMDLGTRLSVVNGKLAGTFTAEHSGELTCFANDLPFDFTYGNNKGKIALSVEVIE